MQFATKYPNATQPAYKNPVSLFWVKTKSLLKRLLVRLFFLLIAFAIGMATEFETHYLQKTVNAKATKVRGK